MTNKTALGFGLVLLLIGGVDAIFFGSEHFVFLGKRFYELIEWMAFWR